MKLHPRRKDILKADSDIRNAIIDTAEKYELTFGELVGILSSILSSNAKDQIRFERHGNYEKPGEIE